MESYKYLLTDISSHLEEYIFDMPDYSSIIDNEYDMQLLVWLFNQYIILLYRIIHDRHSDSKCYIPYNVSKPLLIISKKLKIFPWISMYYICYNTLYPRNIFFNPDIKDDEIAFIENSKKIYSIFNTSISRLKDDDGSNFQELYDLILGDLVHIGSIITKNTIMKTPKTHVVFIGDNSNQAILFKNTSEPYDVLCFYESLIGICNDDFSKHINTPTHIRVLIIFFKNVFFEFDNDKYISIIKSIRSKFK